MGLSILGVAILVIAGYGIAGHNPEIYTDIQVFTWLPRDGMQGVSRWFGCVVFGFGIVPLTFNFRESMLEPQRLPHVALISMLLVAAFYIVTGVGLLYLYPTIDADVLSQIPNDQWLATLTRLAMIVVVVATAPLLVIPCSLIVEGKLHNHDSEIHPMTRLWTRICLCFGTVAVSVMVPEFVLVLSFVGCFSVSLVSFCLPPLLHCTLLIRHRQAHNARPTYSYNSTTSTSNGSHDGSYVAIAVDCIALLCGIITTVVTTLFTVRKAIN
jgi:amino acid permease